MQWVLSSSVDLGVPTRGVSVTAEFADGRMTGDSGCNAYNAPYRTTRNEITIGPQIASTQMACAPERAAVEQAYLARLPRVKTFTITGRTLTLRRDKRVLLAYDAADGAAAIVGKWTATSLYTGSAVQSVALGSTLTAEFDAGQVSGDSGCNTFGGPYEANGTTIKLGPLHTTLRACAEAALQTQEQQYQAALEQATTFSVTGERLDLFRADGGIAATFEKAPAT
ncbi:MAG: META domain-containing protein [Acidimicrobiia bacterium]